MGAGRLTPPVRATGVGEVAAAGAEKEDAAAVPEVLVEAGSQLRLVD